MADALVPTVVSIVSGAQPLQGIHVSPDIFDSSWAGVPFSTLVSWALAPASDDALHALHDKGRADAAAWARLTGVGDAAAPDHDDLLRYVERTESAS